MNQRETGVHRVKLENGNGQHEEVIEVSVTRASVWKILGISLPILAAIVWGATKFGAMAAVDDRIKVQVSPPSGVIYQAVESCVHEHSREILDEVAEDLAEEIVPLDEKVTDNTRAVSELKGSTDALIRQQQTQHEDTMRILRQIRTNGGNQGDG